MNAATPLSSLDEPTKVLDRHATRRSAGVPTVSLLVGPAGAGGGTWRRWAFATGRGVIVARRNHFPTAEWVRSVAEMVDLLAAAVQCLARRGGRDPDAFLAVWRAKTAADRECFWNTLAPGQDDA